MNWSLMLNPSRVPTVYCCYSMGLIELIAMSVVLTNAGVPGLLCLLDFLEVFFWLLFSWIATDTPYWPKFSTIAWHIFSFSIRLSSSYIRFSSFLAALAALSSALALAFYSLVSLSFLSKLLNAWPVICRSTEQLLPSLEKVSASEIFWPLLYRFLAIKLDFRFASMVACLCELLISLLILDRDFLTLFALFNCFSDSISSFVGKAAFCAGMAGKCMKCF